jgi:hypothetical protein
MKFKASIDDAFNFIESAPSGTALLVVINDIESSEAEKFIQKVMSQLPGVPRPEILVRLNHRSAGVTPQQDAENAAKDSGKPTAIASMEGKLLAYYVP